MEISEWKVYANSVLSPAERTKDEFRDTIARLRENHPEWVRHNDARWAWFTGAKKIISICQLCYLYLKDQLADLQWWGEKVSDHDTIPEIIREFDVFIRYGFSNMLFTITEETLRSIVKAIDHAACKGARADFHSIYNYLLKRIGQEQHLPLFDFHRHIRNTIHNNGIFRPRNGRDVSIQFADRKYEFIVGRKLDFLSFDVLLDLVSRYNAAIEEIIRADPIARLDHVERFQW